MSQGDGPVVAGQTECRWESTPRPRGWSEMGIKLFAIDEVDTTPALDTATALSEALRRVTGDTDGVVAVLDSVFARAERNPWSR